MSSNYTQKLGFKIWKTSIEAKKIDVSYLKTLKIIIANF